MDETDGRGERLQIMLSPSELSALDDFRFQRRMPSRAAAVRDLLRRGLAAEGLVAAAEGTKSSDFGVIESDRPNGGKPRSGPGPR
jgi:metal-responsive CopG/Arc/MetJ family transcriptional regulator